MLISKKSGNWISLLIQQVAPSTSSAHAKDREAPPALWKNHGKFVSCTAKSAESFVEANLITEEEKDAIVSDAAQSDCGDKQ